MRMKKNARRFAAAALGTLLFAAVYERFSHQVYSPYMIFAFLFPLLGGAFPCLLLGRAPGQQPGARSLCLYSSGIAALTVGSIFRGILDIYGSTSRLGLVYWLAGGGLCGLGLVLYVPVLFRQRPGGRTG